MLQPYFTELVGQGSTFSEIRRFVDAVAGNTAPVLILGEMGSGKEAAARSIHLSSGRRSYPFLVVDCSLYYDGELERELFGEDGHAVSGPVRKGILEFSSKGTCYLSNVEEISPSIQERLYNYIVTGYLQRVGSTRPVPSRVRLALASDKNLPGFVEGGLFSRALFDVASEYVLRLPPLRQHPEDILPFARQMAHLYALEHEGFAPEIEFCTEALEALEVYPWPGNYDELKKEILRIFRSGIGRVTPDFLSPEITQYWLGLRSEPLVRKVIEEIDEHIKEFKLMARLDAEYGDILLDTDDWDLHLKYYSRL